MEFEPVKIYSVYTGIKSFKELFHEGEQDHLKKIKENAE